MTKVADVKLSWTKSPSSDIERVQVIVTNDGSETTTDLGPGVESFMIVVDPQKSVQFKVTTFDSENRQATSETYFFTLGDLEDPLPATNLKHEVMAVRETEEPSTPTARTKRSKENVKENV